MKITSKLNHGSTNRDCLHCAILRLQGKRYAIFPSKMFEMRFSRFWKCLNTRQNSPEQPVEWTQK